MENSGTRKFREYQFFMEFKKKKFEKIPGFFSLEGRKFQDFWLHLIHRIFLSWNKKILENSVLLKVCPGIFSKYFH